MPILLHLNRLGWILYHKIILINKQLISFELELFLEYKKIKVT